MPRHASRESAPFDQATLPDKTSLPFYPFFLSPCIPFLFPILFPLSVPLLLFPLFLSTLCPVTFSPTVSASVPEPWSLPVPQRVCGA